MIKSKMLMSIGSGLALISGLIAFSSTSSMAEKKPAIEVVTHEGAGGGTDVNYRIKMMIWKYRYEIV